MTRRMAEELDALAADFDFLENWEDRYRHVLDLGKELAPLAEAERTAANKVSGCASQVWLVSEPSPCGTMAFRGDSDAHIVRGLIAILLRLYSGRRPEDILAFDARAAVGRLGLNEALSSQRANGLVSMIDRIRREAAHASADPVMARQAVQGQA